MQFSGLDWGTLSTIAGMAAVSVTVLYILKLRKRRVQVPFSPLWRQVLSEKQHASDLWKRLRRLFSWLLHLLLVALLAFGLADPHLENEVVEGRHIVLLIDTSASMASTDVSGAMNRLELARQKAQNVLETVGPEDRVMLVTFADQLMPLSPFVSETSVLEPSLRSLKVMATGTAYEEALDFAADSLRDKKRGELVIISDGAGFVPSAETLDLGAGTTVRHLKVGESAGNLAVTGFNVRRYLANKLDYELFVRVESFFDRPVDAEVEIWADGRLVDAKPVALKAREVFQQFYPSQAVAGERLEARVRVKTSDARDVFPLDDRAYALLPELQKTSVLLVSDGNLYLEGPLLLNQNIDLKTVSPAAYTAAQTADVVIFDRVAPTGAEKGNFFYIAPQGTDSPWEIKGTVNDPIITQVRRSHPLMRWISLKDLNIGNVQRLGLTGADEAVATSIEGAPIVVARREDTRSLVALSFDVRNSDFPLRVAFPVFLLNVIDFFNIDESALIESFTTGNAWSVEVPDGVEQVTIRRPDGSIVDAKAIENRVVVYGEIAGFFELTAPGFSKTVAGNISNPEESKIGPQDIQVGAKDVVRDTQSLVFDRHELWIWAVLLTMLLLLAEWVSYNRRWTV